MKRVMEEKHKTELCNLVNNPTIIGLKLSRKGGTVVAITQNKRLVRNLRYPKIVRPDMIYIAGVLIDTERCQKSLGNLQK